jgi:hypothetical protein
MPTWQSERAKIAALTRGIRAGERDADDPELDEAYRNFHALRLEEHVRKVLAEAPRPTDERLQSIAAMLLAGSRPADADAEPVLVKQTVKKQKPRARRDRGAA